MAIETLTLYRFSLPLIRPYKLALGAVHALDTILCVAGDGSGREGFGEATILTGYTTETIEESWKIAVDLAARVQGLEEAQAKPVIEAEHKRAPFTCSALMTAVEMLQGHPLLEVMERTEVPLLAIINAMEEDAIAAEIEARLQEGYGTLKVKVGFDADADAGRVRFIQDTVSGRALIRLDGNQGYCVEDAKKFAASLSPDGIELFEQPCPAGDWDAAVAVADVASVPMMLDESIYGPDDIERAAELNAADFIKLKLMKAGGLDALADGVAQIRDLGMTPVLGNGVASDPGCWMEACAARRLIDTAGEMNGFLKPETGIFASPLAVSNGSVVLEAGTPVLKPAAELSALASATAEFTGRT